MVTLNLKKELSLDERTVKVADLVSEKTRHNAKNEHENYKRIENKKDNSK